MSHQNKIGFFLKISTVFFQTIDMQKQYLSWYIYNASKDCNQTFLPPAPPCLQGDGVDHLSGLSDLYALNHENPVQD